MRLKIDWKVYEALFEKYGHLSLGCHPMEMLEAAFGVSARNQPAGAPWSEFWQRYGEHVLQTRYVTDEQNDAGYDLFEALTPEGELWLLMNLSAFGTLVEDPCTPSA